MAINMTYKNLLLTRIKEIIIIILIIIIIIIIITTII